MPAKKKVSKPKIAQTDLRRAERLDLPKPLLAIVDEHKYVLRLLPLLETEADNIRQKVAVDYECLEDVMHYMVNFPDRYHHPKEDLIFQRMSKQSADVANAVSRLEKDHKAMALQASKLYEKIREIKDKPSRAGAIKLADDLTKYAVSLRNHMTLEEREVLKPANYSLKESDWQEIDNAIAPVVDPIFGQAVTERYVTLMKRYINDFNSVYASGSFPIKLLESLASRTEQRIYVLLEIKEFVRLFLQSGRNSIKNRWNLFRTFPKVKNLADFSAWQDEQDVAKKAARDDWYKIAEQLKFAIEAAGKPIHTDKTHEDLAIIKLHTEKEMLQYQENAYQPSANPKTSWQAALYNLLLRLTLKPMMRHASLERLKKLQHREMKEDFTPPGTQTEAVHSKNFRAEWIIPETQSGSRRTIMHLPGGGFMTAASDMHRVMLGKIACQTQSPVMLVHYRLLPEHPFPAGLEDALSAYRFLLDEGIPPEEIVITGDSAGGCLCLSVMLALRAEGLPLPGGCVLISPLTDLTFSTPARTTNRWRDPMLPSIRSSGAYVKYAGEYSVDDPLVSPIYGSFENFPPTFALVSSTETLLDDTLVVARKARTQGVDFEVEVWHNMPHVWTLFSFLPEADATIDRICAFIEKVVVVDKEHVFDELPMAANG